MKAEGLKYFTDLQWPLLALILFVSAFVLLTWVLVKTYRNETLAKVENLPFEGEGS